ncbi:MAG: peptidoglycan DD-metalloendopeptidase family protein [Burkholderiaceae bacterium]
MKANSILFWMTISIALSACVSQRPAPVVDRSGASAARAATMPPVPVRREAKDGIYVAQSGDTLFSIAQSFNVDQRDLIRWNDLPEGTGVRVGQALRVTAPPEVATVSPITRGPQAEVRPLPPTGAEVPAAPTPLPPTTTPPPTTPPTTTAPAITPPAVPPVATAPPTAAVPPEAARPPSGTPPWQWPAAGKVIETFDDPRNKGIDISGAEGSPVQAAADGEVVYVGSAVRGYGNLVIVRHNDDFITAYAHNRKVLVAEKQMVKRGQTIAELGRSDADRPKLHFELRHQGKPVDPLKYLPAR